MVTTVQFGFYTNFRIPGTKIVLIKKIWFWGNDLFFLFSILTSSVHDNTCRSRCSFLFGRGKPPWYQFFPFRQLSFHCDVVVCKKRLLYERRYKYVCYTRSFLPRASAPPPTLHRPAERIEMVLAPTGMR